MARPPSKSADAFRTISEVAEEVDVPQHVLRFWETKFPQIKPLKRGGGRRYYRPEDIELIRTIRGWLYDDGYTIKGVQKLLREGAAQQATQSATQQPATEQTATRKPAEAGEAEAPPAGSDTFRAEGVLDFDSGEVDLVEKADEGTGPRPESPAAPAASETAEPAGPDALRAAIRELEAIRDRLRAPGD